MAVDFNRCAASAAAALTWYSCFPVPPAMVQYEPDVLVWAGNRDVDRTGKNKYGRLKKTRLG